MQQKLKEFREKLLGGETVLGQFMKTTDPMFAEAAGYAGFDFVILDSEHGPASHKELENDIRAAVLGGALPIVRVSGLDEQRIGAALDLGAAGVQIPQIRSEEEARSAVASAKFYPHGMRGVCRFVRAAQYSGTERAEYFRGEQDKLVILQLEGEEAIRNLDGILEVDGVDVLFIGPYDLSQSLGVPGQVDSPRVVEAMKSILRKAKERGKTVGTFVDDAQMFALWKNAGVNYLAYSVDVGIFTEACGDLVKQLRRI